MTIDKLRHQISEFLEFKTSEVAVLLPYGLLVMFKGFFSMRTAWFLLTILFLITALACVAWWCGAFRSQHRLLLFSLLFCAPHRAGENGMRAGSRRLALYVLRAGLLAIGLHLASRGPASTH
jgi:hypothetical protein